MNTKITMKIKITTQNLCLFAKFEVQRNACYICIDSSCLVLDSAYIQLMSTFWNEEECYGCGYGISQNSSVKVITETFRNIVVFGNHS